MTLTVKLKQEIQFLCNLDAENANIEYDKDVPKGCEKRSWLVNFIWRCIHYLTLKMIPQNWPVDQVSRSVLQALGEEYKNATADERKFAKEGCQKLIVVIRNNGGAEEAAVNNMIETLTKVHDLPAIKKLPGPHASVAITTSVGPTTSVGDSKPVLVEPTKMTTDTKLQTALHQAALENWDGAKIEKMLTDLLPTIQESVILSAEELQVLEKGLKGLKKTFLHTHVSPGFLECLVTSSFQHGNIACLLVILPVLRQVWYYINPQHNEWSQSFVNSLHAMQPFASHKQMSTHQCAEFMKLMCQGECLFNAMHSFLDDTQHKTLIADLMELVVLYTADDVPATQEILTNALTLLDSAPKWGSSVITALRQLKPPSYLARLVMATKGEQVSLILDYHPPLSEPDDAWFQQLVSSLEKLYALEAYQEKIVSTVMNSGTLRRKQILVPKLPPERLASYTKDIPIEILKTLSLATLAKLADVMIHYSWHLTKPAGLKNFAQALTGEYFYALVDNYRQTFCTAVLPLCTFDTQVYVVGQFLKTYHPDAPLMRAHRQFLKDAQLPTEVWEAASKQCDNVSWKALVHFLDRAEVFAHLVNGQKGNQAFNKEFFRIFFENLKDETRETRTAIMTHLDPEVLVFDKPQERKIAWKQFFKILPSMPDQKKAEALLIKATLNLFDHPNFDSGHAGLLYAMDKAQLACLPIEQYAKPEIRLLLACLTECLNDQMNDTANALDEKQQEEFTYMFATADSHFRVKNFVAWVFKNSSLAPTQKWLANPPAKDVLLKQDILDDLGIKL